MDYGKENFWQIQRKPRFAVDVPRLGAQRCKASKLDSGSQLDKAPHLFECQTSVKKDFHKSLGFSNSGLRLRKEDGNRHAQSTISYGFEVPNEAGFSNEAAAPTTTTTTTTGSLLRHSQLSQKKTSAMSLTPKDNCSSSVLYKWKRDDGSQSLDRKESQEEKTSFEACEPKHTYKDDSTSQSHLSNRNLGSCQKYSRSRSTFRKDVDMDKLRAIITRARARRASLMKSAEKMGSSLNAEIPVGTLTEHSLNKRNEPSSLTSPKFISSKRNCYQTDFPSNIDEDQSSQECCRALCFDDIQEVQEPEELTTPLDMMDMTAMISGASVLQSEQKNQNCRPCISQENSNRGIKTSEAYRARGSKPFKKVNIPELHPSSQSDHRTVSYRIPRPEIKTEKAVANMENRHIKQPDKIRIQRRRSAMTLKHTPKFKINNKDSKVVQSSKLAKLSEKKVLHRNSVKKKNAKVESHSNGKMILRSSQLMNIPKIAICPPDPEPEVAVENQSNLVEKCDASTTTQIFFGFGKSPDNRLVQEVEKLMHEQEEINKRAKDLYEQGISRRQRMKDTRVLESFLTSVSPLRRLRSMVAEKPSFLDGTSPSCAGSVKVTEEIVKSSDHYSNKGDSFEVYDMDISGVGNASENQSLMECSILNTTSDLNLSQHKWKHLKLDSRIFQTPSSRPKKVVKKASPAVIDEEFENETGEDLSPFTEMVGDCERPSLAPMTPHSHHQVSMIKMSLRKQLNQLYE